jgi:hypothetical protein
MRGAVSGGSFIFGLLVCGGIAALIGQRKNFNVFHSFLFGALLGPFGIGILIAQRSNLPNAPPGMIAARCLRCSAVQNISSDQMTFECWQCKLRSDVPSARSSDPESLREWLNRAKKRPGE